MPLWTPGRPAFLTFFNQSGFVSSSVLVLCGKWEPFSRKLLGICPPTPFPSTVHPSGQTGFYAARNVEKYGGTLTGCDVLVPDEILKLVELVKMTQTYQQKQDIDITASVFLPLKLEPNVPLRGVEERDCLDKETGLPAGRTILRERGWVCVRVCRCVFEQIVRTFLWDESSVGLFCVEMYAWTNKR